MRVSYPKNWKAIAKRIKKRDNYVCRYCKKKHRANFLQVHHVVPLSCGGSNCDINLKTICFKCHREKHPHLKKRYLSKLKSNTYIKRSLK